MMFFQNVDIEEREPRRSLPTPTGLPLPQPTPPHPIKGQLAFFPSQSLAWARVQVSTRLQASVSPTDLRYGVCRLSCGRDAGQVGRRARPLRPGGWRVWGLRSPARGTERRSEASALQRGGGERACRPRAPGMSGCPGRGAGCCWRGALWGLGAGADRAPRLSERLWPGLGSRPSICHNGDCSRRLHLRSGIRTDCHKHHVEAEGHADRR